jgi:Xaa-Pro aminopeptidase
VSAARAERLAELVSSEQLERLLVTNLVNVRYLTGFTGTNGACVCGPDDRVFVTDFRYTERAEQEVEGWEVVTVRGEWLPALAERLRGRCGFEDHDLSVRSFSKLEGEVAEGTELVAAGPLVERLRRVKDSEELAAIAEAAKLADVVYEWSLELGLRGRSERDVARAAAARIRELGAEPSFPPIVAAGPNGALPHAEPGEREIGADELVIFDMGAQLDGYCSDCTRTLATGEGIGDQAEAVYALVHDAQQAALEAVAAGKPNRDVDAVAREMIEAAGHGERFGHGLGHGVGLEVHEGPSLNPRSEDSLLAGEVVTIEPGVYLPGEFGVRIEDLVVATEGGHRNLSALPKELRIVD